MKLRLAAAVLAATATLILPSLPASADTPECQITNVTPHVEVVGAAGAADVPLRVRSNCPDGLRWYVNVNPIDWRNEYHYGYLMATNFAPVNMKDPYRQMSGSTFRVEGLSNSDAGQSITQAWGFYGSGNGPTGDDDWIYYSNDEGAWLRQTYFALQPNASPEPIKRGKALTVSGLISRADWNRHLFTPSGLNGDLELQFKKDGWKTYHHAKDLTMRNGAFSTKVTAGSTGYWRIVFDGDDVSAGITSRSDHVIVRR